MHIWVLRTRGGGLYWCQKSGQWTTRLFVFQNMPPHRRPAERDLMRWAMQDITAVATRYTDEDKARTNLSRLTDLPCDWELRGKQIPLQNDEP